jgi:putative hemolysin
MEDPALQILVIVGLAILNGVLAMSEIAVVSARRARLRQAAESGDASAAAALKLTTEPSQFLATVQIGITLVGIVAGAFGQATLANALTRQLAQVPLLAPYAAATGTVIVVGATTYLSIVVGELVPKRLALINPERIASLVAGPMNVLSAIARPVVWLLSASTNSLVRLLGIEASTEPDVTPEEIATMIEEGTERGIFEEAEHEILESVLRLDERRVDAYMTPRSQVTWIDLDHPEESIRQILLSAQHSRFPVIQGDPDNVLGILYTKDLLVRQLQGEPFNLRETLRPVRFVPESMSPLRLLELFKTDGGHIAMVTDEYGSIEGMVTDMDILEAIAGQIPGEGEPEEPQAMQRDDGTWLVDGLLRIDQLWEELGIEKEMDAIYRGYQTVSGFVMANLAGIPNEGESFLFHGLCIEVIDMDGRRIDKVLVTPGDRISTDSETEERAVSRP